MEGCIIEFESWANRKDFWRLLPAGYGPYEEGELDNTPEAKAGGGCGSRSSASPPHMFNFSANHLFLLSRTEYRKCAVFLLQDLDTQRVYQLYDFTKALLLRPAVAYSIAGKVNSADKLYLVIESVRLDTKHSRLRSPSTNVRISLVSLYRPFGPRRLGISPTRPCREKSSWAL
jgi:hypothetical protein